MKKFICLLSVVFVVSTFGLGFANGECESPSPAPAPEVSIDVSIDRGDADVPNVYGSACGPGLTWGYINGNPQWCVEVD